MTSRASNEVNSVGYGARPVSVDTARGRALSEAIRSDGPGQLVLPASRLPLTHQVVADRLSLAHWPPGHQIVVCALSGGTGRTTMAGLMATVLAELPFAHIWHPIALLEVAPRTLGSTQQRWDVINSSGPDAAGMPEPTRTRSGAWTLTGAASKKQRRDFSVLVVDSPAGMPSDLVAIEDDMGASIVLMTRPDRASLFDAADALVWMNDRSLVARGRVTVVINHGVGAPDQGSKAAAAALGIRCATVHSLPQDSTLAPGRPVPSGRALPTRIRRRVAHVCLDIWTHANTPDTAPSGHNSQE